jgi:predicted MFS family arabinose efflux permease
MEAWLVDALNASGFDGLLDDIFARASMVSAVAMLIGTVLGGILGTWNLALPFLMRCALLVVVFLVALVTMREIGFTPRSTTWREMPAEMNQVARNSITFGWQQPSVRLLILASFFQAIFFAWGFYAWQPYFLELLGQDAPWVAGLIAAFISLATMAGNYIVQRRSHRDGRRTSLLLAAAVVGSLAAIGVGLVPTFWLAVSLYLLSSLASGVWMPVKQSYMHQFIPSEQRATVVSFDSLVSSGGMFIGQIGLGRLAETRSIAAGYVVGGLATALAWPVVLRLRRRSDPQDIIIDETQRKSPCGAQGIPCVSGVDSQAGTALPN